MSAESSSDKRESDTPRTDAASLTMRLRADAAMNLELPDVSHLQHSGQLESDAADHIERLERELAEARAELAGATYAFERELADARAAREFDVKEIDYLRAALAAERSG